MYLSDKKIKIDDKVFNQYDDMPKYITKYFGYESSYVLGYDFVRNDKIYVFIFEKLPQLRLISKIDRPMYIEFTNSNYNKKHIYIDDICICYYNHGYGSLAMKYLIEYSKSIGCKYISGNLRYADVKDHKDRLFHFYQKFNFSINEIGENEYKIRLDL